MKKVNDIMLSYANAELFLAIKLKKLLRSRKLTKPIPIRSEELEKLGIVNNNYVFPKTLINLVNEEAIIIKNLPLNPKINDILELTNQTKLIHINGNLKKLRKIERSLIGAFLHNKIVDDQKEETFEVNFMIEKALNYLEKNINQYIDNKTCIIAQSEFNKKTHLGNYFFFIFKILEKRKFLKVESIKFKNTETQFILSAKINKDYIKQRHYCFKFNGLYYNSKKGELKYENKKLILKSNTDTSKILIYLFQNTGRVCRYEELASLLEYDLTKMNEAKIKIRASIRYLKKRLNKELTMSEETLKKYISVNNGYGIGI